MYHPIIIHKNGRATFKILLIVSEEWTIGLTFSCGQRHLLYTEKFNNLFCRLWNSLLAFSYVLCRRILNSEACSLEKPELVMCTTPSYSLIYDLETHRRHHNCEIVIFSLWACCEGKTRGSYWNRSAGYCFAISAMLRMENVWFSRRWLFRFNNSNCLIGGNIYLRRWDV